MLSVARWGLPRDLQRSDSVRLDNFIHLAQRLRMGPRIFETAPYS